MGVSWWLEGIANGCRGGRSPAPRDLPGPGSAKAHWLAGEQVPRCLVRKGWPWEAEKAAPYKNAKWAWAFTILFQRFCLGGIFEPIWSSRARLPGAFGPLMRPWVNYPWFLNIRCNAEAYPSPSKSMPGAPACKGLVALGPAQRERGFEAFEDSRVL